MNLDAEFKQFDENIKLTSSKKEHIINSRNAIRKKICNYFEDELEIKKPNFMRQGSFAINTALNPIDEKEVDIDDGLYFNHIDGTDEDSWPSPKDAHKMVLDALDGHTKDGCENKTSCVRVFYKNDYHVDIPVYIMKGSHAKLANIKTNKWENSDSKDFKDWFYKNRKDEQTNRIVRYLKAWRDYNDYDFASIELTILAVQNHIQDNDDGISLKLTVEKICAYLRTNRKIEKPVAPFENLLAEKTDKIDSIIKKFEQLKDDLILACGNKSKSRATIILHEQFGDRFPIVKDENQERTREYTWSPKPWAI